MGERNSFYELYEEQISHFGFHYGVHCFIGSMWGRIQLEK